MGQWRDRAAGYAGVIVGLVLLCGLFAAMARSMRGPASLPPHSDSDGPAESVHQSTALIEENPLAVRGDESRSGVVRVFECVRGGQHVFSDQPCGADARPREIDVAGMNTYEEIGQVPETRVSIPEKTPPRPIRPSRSSPSQEAQCESLQRAKDEIDARMRRGYTSREGERLRARRHEVEDRYRDLHCLRGRG